MLATRDANGNQVANPDKFPDGFKAVADYIHSLGMLSGLYTAKGHTTCAGFAASCEHEVQDAAQWAQWGIDYVKDDSCSSCRNNDNEDYGTMWEAIMQSGRAMVLTVEGSPDDALISKGGYGNAKRVGHDISPLWMSMVSLVDIASGLWPYAHNSTNATFGGWWNDLDMIEVGNSPDFSCGDDAAALARCQAHMSMWCALKSPLVLGNDIPNESPATLGVLSNAEAIAVNQDPWGVQARRVAVQAPRNGSLTASPADNVAVIAPCDAAEPTQAWTFVNRSGGPRDGLYLTPCDATDPYQQWVADAGGPTLRNVGSNACVDSAGRTDPGQVLPCDASKASQHWAPQPGSQHVANGAACLDVFNFAGPDVEIGSCKAPGAMDSNQVWVPLPGGLLRTNSTGAPAGSCLAVEAGPPGGVLRTTDALGATWCLTNRAGAEGEWGGGACDASDRGNSFDLQSRDGGKTWAIQGAGGSPSWNTQVGASGPHPHTRYISGYSWSGSSAVWLLDPTAPSTPITASDKTGIIDDDLVGHVTKGGAFCLQLSTGGLLEVWAGVLSPDARGRARLTVVLFNRSPGDDVVTVPWAAIGAPAGTAYAVRDIWAAADIGTFTGDFTRPVAAHSTAFLVLTATG